MPSIMEPDQSRTGSKPCAEVKAFVILLEYYRSEASGFNLEARRMLPTTAQSPASGAATAATATVLVVEDDESMRTLLRRMLERTGFAVVTAINGRDGMERFREHPVDIVITDMIMPEIDGVELIQALRGKWPDVRIIAISGIDYPYLRMALGCGAKAPLRKPVDAARRVETVQRVLAASRDALAPPQALDAIYIRVPAPMGRRASDRCCRAPERPGHRSSRSARPRGRDGPPHPCRPP